MVDLEKYENESKSQHIKITVKDDGVGMTKKEQKNLFKIFNTNTTKGTNVKGIGLGLCISKMLVNFFNG